MASEIWKSIPGYGCHYEASSFGNIRVKDRFVTKRVWGGKIAQQFYKGRLLSPARSNELGHLSVHIGVDKKRYTVAAHKLVLLAFVGYPKEGQECCHNNGIASDNRPENLRWDSHFSNNQDRKAHGNYATCEKHPMTKLSIGTVNAIREGCFTAEDAGISKSHHWAIRKGVSWSTHVTNMD